MLLLSWRVVRYADNLPWPQCPDFSSRHDNEQNATGPVRSHSRCQDDDDAERQANLARFKAWVGNWSHKRWAEITKEEMDGITVKY